MLPIFFAIAPLFLLIFGAAVVQKFRKIDEKTIQIFNNFSLNFGFPALIFLSIFRADFSAENAKIIFWNSIFLLEIFGGIFLFKKFFSAKMFRTIFISAIFGNVAYLGIPVLTQIFGAEILPDASILIAIYIFWIFTFGVGFLEWQKNKKIGKNFWKNLAKNPLLISVFAGIFFAIFEIPLPKILHESAKMLANSVTPIVLIVIGLFVGKINWREKQNWAPIFLFSIFSLLILPAIFLAQKIFFKISIENFAPSIIEAAMLLAISPFALAEKYNLDQNFIARAIFLSTIFSIFSLPFWIFLLKFFNF